MTAKDFNVYNMPAMMARVVKRPDPQDSGKWIRDDSWHASVRETFFNLFKFFQENHLVDRELVRTLGDVDSVVLRFGELTPEGQRFVKARADERWLSSFDRPNNKRKLDDVSYLKKQLDKLRSTG